jgi:tetratricopeptide (TPR) repeat protein
MVKFQQAVLAAGLLTLTVGLGSRVMAQSEGAPSSGSSPAQGAAQQNPAYSYIYEGDRAYADRKYKESIEFYTQALKVFNQNAYAYYNRGNAHRKLKDYPAAIDDYTAALQLNPRDIFVYLYRGMSYQATNEFDKAVADYTEAIKLDELNPVAFHHRAQSYVSLKQLNLARDDFKKSADLYRKKQESGLSEKVLSEMRALK